MLVEGPVTVIGDDGVSVTSERFMVAVCTCRRSRAYPWCDTSHRRRVSEASGPRATADTAPRGDEPHPTDDPSSPTRDDTSGDPE
ncbi:CDGSH iron-sulfur domain-containing protein [Streptomyces sp. NPDC059883]|uniref:CDGSH iron-sulfur domain-containing protein n=1 Tax=unclassified Streptomyces TaxID=2593676 RepID=UPI003669C666